MQINASYMIDNTFLGQYGEHGKEYLKSKAFQNYFHVSYHQARYDCVYFYGILRTVTRSGGAGRKHVLRYQSTNDGFLTWHDMLEDCEHDGSIRVRIEKLKSIVTMPYTKKFSGGLIAFVDQFQTSIEELGTLLPMYSSEDNKLEFLTTALNKSRRETSYYLDYIRDHHLTFRQACAHIRERALMNDVFDDHDGSNKRFNKAAQIQTSDKQPEDSFKQVYTIMQNWAEETGNDIHHVYATMNASQPLRESLMIPTKLWIKLAPDIKKAIVETRKSITTESSGNASKAQAIPKQYSNPAKVNHTAQSEQAGEEDDRQAHKATSHSSVQQYGLLYEDSSDEDSDEFELNERHVGMVNTGIVVHHQLPIDLVVNYATSNQAMAYADGGADSCIGGNGWVVHAYTGRKANLVGYDERNTKKDNLDICTLLTKVQPDLNKPAVILVAHEMVYNLGSSTTLISEFQVRNHGCIMDSVSKSHRLSLEGNHGTQTFYPRDDLAIPLHLKKGLMGFHISAPTKEEIDSLEHITITSDNVWNPYTHTDDNYGIDFQAQKVEANANVPCVYDPTDLDLESTKLGEVVQCPLVNANPSNLAQAVSTWHRTNYKLLDPELIQPYLAYRPLEVVKKTLEKTTQLAKMIVRFPLRRHVKARFKWANVTRINETVSTDPLFSNVKSAFDGFIGAQVFYGCTSHCINVYGIKSKGEFHLVYKDFIREHGAPSILRRDNAKEENNAEVLKMHRDLLIKDEFIEPHHPQQNPVESRAIKWLKETSLVLMNRLGVPGPLWYYMLLYLADIHNICADKYLNWSTPIEKRTGVTPDISAYLQFQFWEKLLVLDTEETWPSSKEKPVRYLGVAHNIGDILTFLVFDVSTRMVLARRVLRPATLNKRVQWDPELQSGHKHTANIGGI